MVNIQQLFEWVMLHGYRATKFKDHVAIDIPARNQTTGLITTERIEVRNFVEAKVAIGY